MFKLELFGESEPNLRHLVQILYAIVTPSFLCVLIVLGQEQVFWSALATLLICCAGFLFTRLSPTLGPWGWIFPGGVAPVLCCGLAALSLGSDGWVFLAVSTAPIAWAATLFSAPAVVGALVAGVLVCFSVLTVHGGWEFGLAGSVIYAIIEGLVGWVVLAKADNLRSARLESLSKHVDEIELTLTPEGMITFASERAVREYGYPLPQLLGKSIQELCSDPDSKDFQQQLSEVHSHRIVFETKHRRADGSVFPVEVSSRTFQTRGRQVIHSVIRDISEQRAREQALQDSLEEQRKSQYQLQAIIDSMSEGLVTQLPSGQIIRANAAAERVLGLSRDQLLGRTSVDSRWSAIHEDGSPWPGEAHPSMMASRTGLRLEDQIMGVNDPVTGRRWLSINAVPLFLSGGPSADQSIATFVDITDKLRFEQELLKTRQRYQMIFEHSGTGNAIFDTQCRLLIQNRQAELDSKVTSGFNLGKTVEELYGEDRGATLRSRITSVLTLKVAESLTTRVVIQGTERWFESTIIPLFEPGQTGAVGVHVQLRDTTTEHELESRLIQAQKIDSLGVLAGGIAHDFNNLLAGLSGNVELATLNLQSNRVEAALEKLAKTQAVFVRAKALTRQVLTFSRGGAPIRNPQNLVADLARWAEFALVGSDLKLELDVDPALWNCLCDLDQIGQIIDNLIVNARQASVAGATIALKAQNVPGSAPTVRIQVTDLGTGIEPELIPKIFDPFFTTKPGGTGLGLATAFSIARRHEGLLSVESQPGVGSTFTLSLPALQTQDRAPTSSAELRPFHGRGVALVMDDQESVREALVEMLELLGFEVLHAADGQAAIEQFHQSAALGRVPAVVFADLTVPGGMGGKDMVNHLRREGVHAAFVAISGYSAENSAPGSTEVFDARLPKPFTMQELTAVLSSVLALE